MRILVNIMTVGVSDNTMMHNMVTGGASYKIAKTHVNNIYIVITYR